MCFVVVWLEALKVHVDHSALFLHVAMTEKYETFNEEIRREIHDRYLSALR